MSSSSSLSSVLNIPTANRRANVSYEQGHGYCSLNAFFMIMISLFHELAILQNETTFSHRVRSYLIQHCTYWIAYMIGFRFLATFSSLIFSLYQSLSPSSVHKDIYSSLHCWNCSFHMNLSKWKLNKLTWLLSHQADWTSLNFALRSRFPKEINET